MVNLLGSRSIVAICLIVTLEEANVPLPIPGDLLLLYAGAMSAHSPWLFVWWLLLLTVFPSFGTWVLYAVVRRGGRPLLTRYGRYLGVGPRELARSEALLTRYGWRGVAIGRSVPLLRHAVTIACGVLGVPLRSFLIGQLIGGAVNALLFMLLGALVGPTLVESLHLPRQAVRLGELLLVAIGLPAGLCWLWRRMRRQAETTAVRQAIGPRLLAGLAGGVALSAAWSALMVGAGLLGHSLPAGVVAELAQQGVGQRLPPNVVAPLLVAGLLGVCAGLALIATVLVPPPADERRLLGRDVPALWALMAVALVLLLAAAGAWQAGDAALLGVGLALSSLAFALTTAYGRALALAFAAGARPWDAQD